MKSLQNVLELIGPGIYMTSIDLKDAFYSVAVHKNYQAYLTFFVVEYFKFVCMPNGMGQRCEYLQKLQKSHFLFLQKKVSYL